MYTYFLSALIFGLVGFLVGKIIVKACHLDKKDDKKNDDDGRTK